jgi:trigger factor
VQGVKEKRIPPLDAEAVKRLSEGEYDTPEALRARVRSDLEEQARRLDEITLEQEVLRKLVEAAELEVPAALVDAEVERELDDLEHRLSHQGVKLDLYLAYQKLTSEQWLEQARPQAEQRLKIDLVLQEVARGEGIEPTEEEVLTFIETEAAKDDELKSRVPELKDSAATRRYFKRRLQRIRTLDRLVERIAKPTAVTGQQSGSA